MVIDKILMEGKLIKNGDVDAMSISGESELPKYKIFVSKKNDLTLSINQEDGF